MHRVFNFFSRKFVIKIPYWIFFTTPLIAYLFCEIYWYFQVGLGFIKWHTSLMLYVYLWLILIFPLYIILNKKHRLLFYNITLSISSLLIVCFILEVIFFTIGFKAFRVYKSL